jgi:hypothetical protein
MYASIRWTVLGAVAIVMSALAAASCAPMINVQTMVAPDARLEGLQTFRVLPVPRPVDGQRLPSDDPMVNNSIANRTLRETLVNAFERRGYIERDTRPDFAVAFYASTREQLDVTRWDYGYPYSPRWRWPYRGREVVTTYTEGTVIVDVIDPARRELLWRGEGVTELTDDATENIARLQDAVDKVVARFPRAVVRPVASR